MNNSVQMPNEEFDFSSLSLANPQGLQGGAYFSKLKFLTQPVLIQTPKCSTKNGIHKTEKKIYCDLMFTNDNEEFVKWTQELEKTIKNLIYEKRNLWFHNDMDLDSIDYHWQNLLRTYKGNKLLLRCFVPKTKTRIGNKTVQIYNEEEEVLTLEDIDKTSNMISILEVSGLKFTSQSFQLEFMLRQIMLIKEKPLFNKCLIKINKPTLAPKPEHDSDADSDISIEDQTLELNQGDKDHILENQSQETQVEEGSSDIVNEGQPEEPMLEEDKTIQIEQDISENNIIDSSENLLEDINNISENNFEETETTNNLEELESVKQQQTNPIESLEKNGIMNEIEILAPTETSDTVTLKKPNEVYMEIYKEAKKKAKEAKQQAIQAYLEAKRIKSLYLLDEIESSDDELDFEAYTN